MFSNDSKCYTEMKKKKSVLMQITYPHQTLPSAGLQEGDRSKDELGVMKAVIEGLLKGLQTGT
jgi:hypothetical protein